MLFRRKGGGGTSEVNANGWMISYADMVTILLAMFIVLSTLSKDQTGMSLYYGTGSYRKAVKRFGLPGVSNNTAQTVSQTVAGPKYKVENPNLSQPDQQGRVIDGEEEIFQHFLGETQKEYSVTNLGKEAGRSAVDFHSRLNVSSPMLSSKQRDMILPLLILAQQKGYRVEIVVWAATPAETACSRALAQASQLRDELVSEMSLDGAAAERIVPFAQPWRFRDLRRPTFSVAVVKQEASK